MLYKLYNYVALKILLESPVYLDAPPQERIRLLNLLEEHYPESSAK
jgi:hypothetical protein